MCVRSGPGRSARPGRVGRSGRLCPDLAFMFGDGNGDGWTVAPIEIPGVDGSDDRPLVGISVRWHSFPGSDDPQARRRLYMKALADTADSMIERHGARVVIVPQTLEDLKAGRALYREIAHRGDVVLLEDDLSPADLRRLYARCRILIGTRMHANILAMGAGTPVVAIAYQPKTAGIMAVMGLDDWVLSIDDVSELVARAHDLWIHADDVRELLAGKVEALRAATTSAARELRAMTGTDQFANRPDMTEESNGSALDSDQMTHCRPRGGQLNGNRASELESRAGSGFPPSARAVDPVLLRARAARGLRLLQAPDQAVHRDGLARLQQQPAQPAGRRAPGRRQQPTQQAQQNTNVKLVQLGDMAAKTAALLGQGLTQGKGQRGP